MQASQDSKCFAWTTQRFCIEMEEAWIGQCTISRCIVDWKWWFSNCHVGLSGAKYSILRDKITWRANQFQLLAANSAMVINPISARVISSSFECHLVTSQDHYPLYHPWDKCQYALEDTPNCRRFLQLKQKTIGERCFWLSFQEKAREMVLVRLKDNEVSFLRWKIMIWLVTQKNISIAHRIHGHGIFAHVDSWFLWYM